MTTRRTEDGREIISIYFFGYEYVLVEAKKRDCARSEFQFPQPNFLGHYNFGLRACKKISSYKLKKLNFK